MLTNAELEKRAQITATECDGIQRARAINWMFAAHSTIESPIVDRTIAILPEGKEAWHEARLPLV